MSTGTTVLFGDIGPRGRRRVAVATVASVLVLAWLVSVAVSRLDEQGQLDPDLWEPFTEWSVIDFLLKGLWSTLRAAGVAAVGAVVVGSLMALGRLAKGRLIRWSAGAYVELFRAMPLLLLIFFAFLVPPQFHQRIEPFWALVIGLALYNSAMIAEILRAGILSLDRGQRDAATALGMSYGQSMRLVILPQAVRRMVPAVVSQVVVLLKDTSLGYVITYEELLRRGEEVGTYYHNTLQSLVVAALAYMVVNMVLSALARRLERRRSVRSGGLPALAVARADEDVTELAAEAGPMARR